MDSAEPRAEAAPPQPVPTPRRRLTRSVARWVGTFVAVLGTNAAAISVVFPDRPPFEDVFPTAVGTTWVYAVTGGEHGASLMVRQATGPASVDLELPHQTIVRERFLGPDGTRVGPDRVLAFAQEGSEFLLLSEGEGSSWNKFEPPIPIYRLDAHTGEAWEWRRSLEAGGPITLESIARIRLFGLEPVIAAGQRLSDCSHYERVLGGLGETEVHEEWLCPGIGPALLRHRVGDAVTEFELVAFRSSERRVGSLEALPWIADQAAEPDDTVTFSRYVPEADVQLAAATRTEWATPHLDYPPLAASGLVVLSASRGTIYARDAATGEIPWRLELPGGIAAPPVLAGDLVVLADIERTLWGLDLETGTARWSAPLPEVIAAPPAVGGGVAVIPLQDGTVRAFRADDGSFAWSVPAAADLAPVVTGTRVILPDTPQTLTAVELSTGEPAWTARVPAFSYEPLSASDQLVVGHTEETVHAVQPSSGRLVWAVAPEMEPSERLRTEAAVTPSAVVLLGSLGTLVALSPSDGSTLWRARASPSEEAPLVVGSDVLVASEASVRAFSLEDGSEKASWAPRIPPRSAPLALSYGDGTVFATFWSEDGWPLAVVSFDSEPAASPPIGFEAQRRLVPRYSSRPVSTGDGLLVVSSGGPGEELWRIPSAGRPVRLAANASIPFAVPAGELVITRLGPDVVALPATGGAPLWRVPVGVPPPYAEGEGQGVPALAPTGDRAFVPTADGRLLSIDVASGATLWEYVPGQRGVFPDESEIPGASEFADPFEVPGVALALPDGDVVFGGHPIVRLDGADGSVEWALPGLVPEAAMAFDDGVVIARGSPMEKPTTWFLEAIDATTGRSLWRTKTDGGLFSAPVAGSGIVVVREAHGTTQALNAKTGDPIWSFDPPAPIGGTPVLFEGVVAVPTQSTFDERKAEHQVALLELATGRYLAAIQLFEGDAQAIGGSANALAIATVEHVYLFRASS